MTKRFLYEFNGTVFVEAENEDEAEKQILGIPLADYLVDEDIYEIDEASHSSDSESPILLNMMNNAFTGMKESSYVFMSAPLKL